MSAQHTPGPWIVIERRHPYGDGRKAHIERNIYTERDHPQLYGKYPIVCISVGIGMDGKKAVQFVHIDEEDARLIAAAPDLLEALKQCRSAIKGGQEVAPYDSRGAGYEQTFGVAFVEHLDAAIAKATGENQ